MFGLHNLKVLDPGDINNLIKIKECWTASVDDSSQYGTGEPDGQPGSLNLGPYERSIHMT